MTTSCSVIRIFLCVNSQCKEVQNGVQFDDSAALLIHWMLCGFYRQGVWGSLEKPGPVRVGGPLSLGLERPDHNYGRQVGDIKPAIMPNGKKAYRSQACGTALNGLAGRQDESKDSSPFSFCGSS